MRILYGIVLGIILIIIFVVSYKKTKDIFSPLCIFSLFQFLRYVPHIIATDYESLTHINHTNVFVTFFFETLFVLFVVYGYSHFKTKQSSKDKLKRQTATFVRIRIPIFIILLVYLIGFGSRVYIIYSLGGISYVLGNMGNAYYQYAHESSGYIVSLGNLMTLGVLMLVYKISAERKKRYYVLLVCMVGAGMLSYMIYSSRSPALELLMITVFGYHFMVKKIRIESVFKPKVLIALLAGVVVICLLPVLRNNSSGNESMTITIQSLFSSIFSSIGNIFNEFSNVGRDTFVYNYFGVENFWYGLNFLNLLVAAIPSSIYINKPCIDDGNYLCNLINGYNVSPNAGRNDLPVKYSIPFSTPGCMYANFGILGIILAGLILGFIFKKTYNSFRKNINPFTVFLYQLVVYQLEFTTLSISQTIIPLVISGLVYYVCMKYFVDKNSYILRSKTA